MALAFFDIALLQLLFPKLYGSLLLSDKDQDRFFTITLSDRNQKILLLVGLLKALLYIGILLFFIKSCNIKTLAFRILDMKYCTKKWC